MAVEGTGLFVGGSSGITMPLMSARFGIASLSAAKTSVKSTFFTSDGDWLDFNFGDV